MIKDANHGNDELTSTELKRLLVARWSDLKVLIPTIKQIRKEMGFLGLTIANC